MLYLKELSEELKSLKPEEYIAPNEKLKPDDNLVGELPDDLKRLYTLWRRKGELLTKGAGEELKKNISELFENIFNIAVKGEKIEKLKTKSATINVSGSDTIKLNRQVELIKEIFWFCVSDSFDLFEKPIVGLRNGFKVVWRERDEDDGKEGKGQAKTRKCFICGEIHD